VRVTLHPISGADTEGQTAIYVERDPTAAVVASVALATDQFESATGHVYQTLTLDWMPQHPTDRNFNLLNPGTVVLATMYVYGASMPATTAIYNYTVELWATLRGRP